MLNRFAKGEIKKLIITVPPQHGKSEGSTRRLPAYMLGEDPNKRIGIASYSTPFARKFNRDIQRIIDTPEYVEIFPDTILNSSNVVTVSSSYLRNSDEFEIVGYKGSLKAVGRGGALTGNSIDIMIMDDLYKDYMEGNSPVIRENVWDWYTTVVKTRLHNHSQELIVFTRWHEDDLIGRIEKTEQVIDIKSIEELKNIPKGAWIKINYEAIKSGEPIEIDSRKAGEALYPQKHDIEKLTDTRNLDPEKFNCLYQGDPRSKEGLLYSEFKTYSELPDIKIVKNYTDTADSGEDYLCSICYGEPLDPNDRNLYVIDLLYTPLSIEHTEPDTMNLLNKNQVKEADFESNNGGRSFAVHVQKHTSCHISWFHQSKNKEARIISNAAEVNKRIVFPQRWSIEWPEFYEHVTGFKKMFKANKQDGAPDVLTGIIEKNELPDYEIYW